MKPRVKEPVKMMFIEISAEEADQRFAELLATLGPADAAKLREVKAEYEATTPEVRAELLKQMWDSVYASRYGRTSK